MADQKPAEHKPDVPHRAAEPPQKSEPEPAAKAQKAALGSAGASISPLVHQALAERAIMDSVDDKDAVKAIDKRLAGLGVSVDA